MEKEREKYSNADKEKLANLVDKYKKLWDEEVEQNKNKPKHYDSKRRKFVHKSVPWGFYYGQGKIKGIISITLAFIYLFLHVSTWLKTNLDFVPTLLLLGTWHSLVTNLNEPISFSYR